MFTCLWDVTGVGLEVVICHSPVVGSGEPQNPHSWLKGCYEIPAETLLIYAYT